MKLGFGGSVLPVLAALPALPAIIAISCLAVTGCSGAPSTRTPAGHADGAAPSSQKSAPATSGAPHGSEAEPRPAPATPTGTAPAAAATSGPATSAAASAARAPVAPLPPVVTTSAPAAATGTAAARAPGAAAAAPASPPTAGAAKPGDPSVIVVDTPDFDPEAQLTLAEAAKAEKQRKAEATPPRIVINNKTIHRYAKGGQLTVAEPKKKAAPAPASASQAPAAAAGTPAALVRDEKYWRGRALEIRQRWRKASDRIKELEEDIGLLRRRFYAQDDPYVRDGQIKPAWDHALDELRESRATAQAAKKELTDFLDEGRIAGALPGWLREGIDLEPKEEKPVDPTKPIETPIYKDSGP
jgi:hypothetical protein